MNRRLPLLLTALAATALTPLAAHARRAEPVAAPEVPVVSSTVATARGGANATVILFDAADPAASVVAGSGELGGVELYSLAGERLAALPAGEAYSVDARAAVRVGGTERTVLAALDRKNNAVRLFGIAPGGKAEAIDGAAFEIGFQVEGMCLYRAPRDGSLQVFVLGGAGEIGQWLLYDTGGRLEGRLVRRMHLASESSYCTVDDATGALYVSEDAVGVWRYDADPETDAVPQIVDIVKFGAITGEVAGLALVSGGDGASYLVAANITAGDFNVYDRTAGDRFIGRFRLPAASLESAAGLTAVRSPVGAAFPSGLLAVADDRKTGGGYRLVSWAAVAETLKLPLGAPQPLPGPGDLALVRPVAETAPVAEDGDAADDPAIWAHPTDPSKSVIIGTDKKSGLYVYDMAGRTLQYLPDGKMNNVDLRNGFKLGGRTVTLVTASDRTNKAIAIYALDHDTRSLTNVADGIQPTGLSDPYGLCMYRGKKGQTYVFINTTEGAMRQWRLVESKAAPGKVKAERVRDLSFATQTEGCVADDDNGALYVAEEDSALWRLGAEPSAGQTKAVVATVKDLPALKDDLEGIGLYAQAKGKGYLVLSSQGNNTYAVFRREGANAYVGSFAVVADGATGIDGSSETDGLDVSSANLGPGFESGGFVAQDGRNVAPPDRQNFKIVPWSAIAKALKLD